MFENMSYKSDFKNAFSYTFLINTYLELAQTLTSGAGKPSLKQGRESKSTEKSEFSAAQRVYLVFIFHEVRTFWWGSLVRFRALQELAQHKECLYMYNVTTYVAFL